MYYYNHNNERDDPNNINFDSNQLFGQSFEDLNSLNDNNNPFLNFDSSHSLPTQPFETSPSPSSGPQDFLLQLQDYNINHNGGGSSFNFFDDGKSYLQDPQAILLSDPNFVRQQQYLLDQQQKAKGLSEPPPLRSNLSAMFNKESPAPPVEPMITSQQKLKSTTTTSSSSNSSNDTNNNNQIGKSKPIPISSPSSLPSNAIDHQRRFNELQARFRINYAKKPSTNKQDSVAGTSVPITTHELSNEITSRRKLSLEPTTMRLNNKIKVATGNHGAKSPTTSMNIPSSVESSSPHHVTASSFPSRTMPIQIQRVQRANATQPFDLEQRQKRLDDQLVKVDFEDITVSELKEMLRQRGKPATGKKAVLLQRLQEEKDMILHARAHGIPIANRYAIQSTSEKNNASPVLASPIMDNSMAAAAAAVAVGSLPDTMMYLSSSPNNAGIGSLNRSIADMHIGSPPMTTQQSRRFAPYAPRAATTTTTTSTTTPVMYSSSVPTKSLDSSMMMMHQSRQEEAPRVMRGFNYKKSYAPFASSALATPDRDDDHNPFDDYQDSPNDMEWTDPTLDYMLQQQHHGKYRI